MAPQLTWLQRIPLWDTFFAASAVATIALVGTTGTEPVVRRGWAVAALVGLAIWYALYARPLLRAEIEDRRAIVYFAGVALLYGVAVLLVSSSSYALLALCPQAFMLMPTLRAIGTVVLLNALGVGAAYLDLHDWAATARGPLAVALTIIGGSAVFGAWARLVSTQNTAHAQLIAELKRSQEEVGRLSHEAGVLAERQRLAGEMHDTVAQGLTSIIMLIQAADTELDRDVAMTRRHLALALAAARDNLAEARAMVGTLAPADLTGASLADALSRLVRRFTRETSVRARFRSEGEVGDLPRAVEVVLLRAVQESLANVRRHADASSVDVRLTRSDGAVLVAVTDDGRGFQMTEHSVGYGLSFMRARMEQVSGTLTVDTEPGAGTTVRVEVPVR